ncbi:MAG: peptide deformylase [Candidatus Cloacimonadales bacterium]
MIREPRLLPIRIIGDQQLAEKAKPVAEITEELKELVEDMLFTMYETDGIGLAAPQVGHSIRLFVVDLSYHGEEEIKNPLVFINPKFTFFEGETTAEEGCLSIPGIYEKVNRAEKVKIEATNLAGAKFEIESDDFLAVAMQHEYDHLDGILFVEKIPKLRKMIHLKHLKELKSRTDENGVNIG